MIEQDWVNATPEQKNFWKLCNGLIGWNTLAPLYYSGYIAASEFLVYDVAKLYMALDLYIFASPNIVDNPGEVVLYDEANADIITLNHNYNSWKTGDPDRKYAPIPVHVKNVYFSRLVQTNYSRMIFNGYRLTIV